MENIDRNWYSPESQKQDRESAQKVLDKMKALEIKFSSLREKVIERTDFGIRIRYIKKEET
ncbi:hypothetical protein [Odoribacter splanchnicus]|jgi:hypothetical protein|uniref:hypothetical protein n=1 Tax=Odoribacter splanchnicus TaxID=28118 RepID=UPI0018982B3A|nr:hypothetical protein [Odoribacter splanchnicus]MDB9201821.1 hypothetical protein [Odoribacter splanchnicus]